jgi:hypothetical protein
MRVAKLALDCRSSHLKVSTGESTRVVFEQLPFTYSTYGVLPGSGVSRSATDSTDIAMLVGLREASGFVDEAF